MIIYSLDKEVKMNSMLQIVNDSLTQTVPVSSHSNWWMVIAIVEFVIIIALLFFKNKADDKKTLLKKRVLNEGEIDFANIIDSSFNAAQLYRTLLIKCHPDNFEPDKEKVAIADDISLRLAQYKKDVKMLNEIKKEAIDKLNINF